MKYHAPGHNGMRSGRTAMRSASRGQVPGTREPIRKDSMTERTPSEQLWLQVTGSLTRDRYALAVGAADGFPPGLRLAGTPLLAPPAWRVPAPVPLESIRLDFRPDTPPPDVPDVAALAPYALPERAGGTRDHRYSDVVAALAAPAVFENRPTYRLVEADLAGASTGAVPRLAFSRGRFFG